MGLLAGTVGNFEIDRFRPVLENGWLNTIWSGRHFGSDRAISAVMTLFILPHVNNNRTWNKLGIVSMILAGGHILLWPVLEVGFLGPEVTSQYIIPCMELFIMVKVGILYQRFEIEMLSFGLLPAITQLTMSLLCGSLAISQTFGLKNHKTLLVPVALLFTVVSYWVTIEYKRASDLLSRVWPLLSLSIAIIVPLVVWLLGPWLLKKHLHSGEGHT
nr:GerAB/ArcD/ProY family transporter [Paenibacillus sp. FJAT-27812]